MMLSEVIAATTTLTLLALFLTRQLAIWHLYVAFGINGGFEKFWQLAYRASLTLLVRQENYTRANSMNTLAISQQLWPRHWQDGSTLALGWRASGPLTWPHFLRRQRQ